MGQGTGVIAAVISIPFLIAKLGQDSFGLFSVFLALTSYAGLLDLGVGRAVTAAVARYSEAGDVAAVKRVVNSALVSLGVIGLVLALLVLALAAPVADLLVRSNEMLNTECQRALRALSIMIPIVLVSGGLRSALEGLREFRVVSKIVMPTGALMFALPAAVALYYPNVSQLVVTLLMVRLISLLMFACACEKRIAGLWSSRLSILEIVSLLKAGGWMTVSNVVSPIMTNLDRLFISSQISPAAAALYVAPYELATKTLLPSGAIANAVYPEFAANQSSELPLRMRRRFFFHAMALTSLAATLPAAIIFIYAPEILTLWISSEFASGVSTDILRTLAVGVAINGAAFIPFAFIQGVGRSDVAAKFHLVELLLFVPALIFAIQNIGVIGAAMVWVGRVTIDAILLIIYSMRKLS